MNAKRLTAYRVVTTLVLLVSAPAGRASFARLVSSLILALSALGGLLLITTIMLPPRAAQASSPDLQAAIAGSWLHTCALKGGQVYCWGRNHYGQLGDNTTTNRITPTLVADGVMGNSGVTAVDAGAYHTCALKGGQVYCWGYNGNGQLGDGTTTQRTTPTLVANGAMGNSGVTAIAVGGYNTCALKGGQVYCWGWNGYGQLGDGTTTYRTTPTLVADGAMGNSGVTAVAAAGAGHTCALKGGRVYCWGRNDYGQLGDGTTTYRNTPVLVANGAMGNSGVTAVAVDEVHTCALKGGQVYCWGGNWVAQLGDGTTTHRNTPVLVANGAMGNSGVTAVAVGGYHNCALKGGQVYCWGYNHAGQLGASSSQTCDGYPCSTTPLAVANGAMGNSGVTAVAGGTYHTLGLKDTICLFAWGWNGYGQLGDGTTTNRNTPVQVSGGCGWGIPLPAPFSKTAPVSGATGLPTTVVLSWTAPASGTLHHYRYCLATTPSCAPSTQVPSTTISVTVSGLAPGATYHWQVRACATSACDLFTDANSGTHWTFTVQPLPSQSGFNKTAPANGATGQPVNNLLLQWTTVADAGHYELCYDTTLNGACNASWLNVSSLSSFLLSGLTLGTTYEWQVRACNIAGCNGGANNGGWWLFTTATGPAAFSKLSPADNSSGLPPSPTLVWASTTGNGTVTYDYCVKTVNAACTGSEWTNVGTLTSTTLSGLSAGTIYYWQVRACDDDGCREANAGSRWKFQTAQAIGSFSKFAPGDGAFNVNTNTAQLQWSQSDGATEYKVCLGTAVNACNILDGGPGQYASVGLNQFRILNDLPLLPNTTYYWQVLATNGVYTTFANGNNPFAFWSFTTLPNGPGNFNKTAPAFNATNVPAGNIAFNWTLASGAVSYTVCIGVFAGDCSYSVTSTATSAVLPGPLPAGATLVWQVTAHNAAGTNNADSNAWWPFTTVPNAPLSFSKYAPVNGASGQPVGVNLAWQDTPDETYYQVCVGTSPGLCTFANVTTTANTTSYALTGLDFGTTYHWQVSACNAGGCTPANGGAAWSFSTLNPPLPGPFYKSAPANGALNVPANAGAVLLQWTASAQANGYEVCMGTSAGSCNLTGGGFRDVSGTLSVTVQQIGVALAPASTYYWQVRAYNVQTATRALADGGVSFHFSTAPADGPAEFGKESPVNGTYGVATGTVALRWFSSAGATSYELCAGTAVNSCDALPGNGWLDVGNALSYTLSGLQAGTTYYWQVRAKNAGGATPADGGGWWRFNTINDNPPAEFSKVTPAHLAAGVPTATAVLSWNVSTGGNAYEVCVGSAPGLCEASGGWVNVGSALQWAVTPALSAATTYWWQVRALGGNTPVQANGGQWWAFTTVSDPPPGPGGFSKLTPPQGASGQPTSALSLTWGAAANATGYEVCLGTQNNLCDVTGNWVSAGNTTNWTVNVALQPATTYWWQVRAVNASGQAQANDGAWWYFTTATGAAAPEAFGKVAPANNAAGQPLNPALSWDPAGGATGYEICVGLLPGDCSKTGGWAGVGGTSYALSGLNYATTYFWQVKAVNAAGQTMADGGVWWRFTTENAPGSPIGAFGKVAPAQAATGVAMTGTLSWGAAENAARYTVCVGTQPGLCDVMNHVEVFSPTVSLTLANAQPGRTYWWQVFAYNDGNLRLADAGQWWAFSVANDPDVGPGDFGKTSPISGTTVANPVGLAWGAASGAVGYRVCVGTAWGLCDAVNQVSASAAPLTITLPAGSYWWQATAVDAEGDTTQADGGAWWPFTVQSGIGNLDNAGTRKEAAPTVVRMGELVSYTIVLSNSGDAAVTARVTDTLAVSATLVSATPGYAQSGQTLAWSNVNVPAGGTAVLTVTVRAASGPLPGGYALGNSVTIGTADGQITRNAPAVTVEPWRAFVPIVQRPPDLAPRVFMPIVMRP
jgi:uncharacterized repeat protein (TIGR01451 family)